MKDFRSEIDAALDFSVKRENEVEHASVT